MTLRLCCCVPGSSGSTVSSKRTQFREDLFARLNSIAKEHKSRHKNATGLQITVPNQMQGQVLLVQQ